MTKVFALLSIAAVFAFASCADKKVEESTVDSVAVVVPAEAAPMDTVVVAPIDTTVKVEATPAH